MPVSHLLRHFILPPGCLLLLGLAGLLLLQRYRRLGRGLLVATLALLYLSSIPLVSDPLLSSLETEPALTAESLQRFHPQAIVVLGGGVYLGAPEYASSDGVTASHSTTFRTRYAARLQRETGLPILCAGGGGPAPELSEARAMTDLLLELGVPPDKIWVETLSQNTWQNAQLSARLLREKGIETILLVTSSYHSGRARYCFERQGLEVVSAPTGLQEGGYWSEGVFAVVPQADAMQRTSQALEEWSGRLFYRLRYRGEQAPQRP